MNVQVNTGSSVDGSQDLKDAVRSEVEGVLERFRESVTRVEVHLTDENAHKGGSDDKRCSMEARVEGIQPVAVTHNAGNVEDAVSGAVQKLRRALDSTLGKRNRHRK
jgi:ribosome-associated translation inhibitor RaiA